MICESGCSCTYPVPRFGGRVKTSDTIIDACIIMIDMSQRSLVTRTLITGFSRQAPPALLGVLEVLEANPTKAVAILEREIQHRSEFVRLAKQARTFVWWRLTDALQGFLVMSVLIVSVLWTFQGLTRVREWARGIDPRGLPGGEAFFNQWRALFVHSPLVSWPWEILAVIATVMIVGLFARHLGVILFSWRDLGPLKAAARSREEEMAVLEGWRRELQQEKDQAVTRKK